MNRRERAAKAKHLAKTFGVSFREPIVKFARTKRFKLFLQALDDWKRPRGNGFFPLNTVAEYLCNGHAKEKVSA